MRIEEGFQQPPFVEGHPYLDDAVLPSLLQRLCPPEVVDRIEPDLIRLGHEVSTSIREIGSLATPPQLIQYDQWGRRVDRLITSESWRALKGICQREGIVGIFYEREFGEFSRVYGFMKVLLMAGDSHVIFCPQSMTDGCARVMELFGTPNLKRDILSRLISRDPNTAFTSGQWMTERPGGSDVSQSETTATLQDASTDYGPAYSLDGFKWFSSATDSDLSVALARTGPLSQGSRSLSLFLIPVRLPLPHDQQNRAPSTSNGILTHRLKNKLGTQIVPTAELSLNSTRGYLIGDLHQGVKYISTILNITRVYSAVGSVGYLRKALDIARSFAAVRQIYSPDPMLLKNNLLHMSELGKIAVTYRALAHLAFGAVSLLGKVECRTNESGVEERLRLLFPVVKGFCAEKGVEAMTECMVALGGQGYMEENSIARLIRDGMVEKIWEGTTTVLALDLVRAVRKRGTLDAFVQWANSILSSCPHSLRIKIGDTMESLRSSIQVLGDTLKPSISPLALRPLFFLLGYLASSIYLLEHAVWSADRRPKAEHDTDVEVLVSWVGEGGLLKAKDDVLKAGMVNEGTRRRLNEAFVYGTQTKL